jgi:hypothetical protein
MHKGGLSHMNFSMKATPNMCTLKSNKLQQQKKENYFYRFKMAAKNPGNANFHFVFRQKFKKHFPEGICQRNADQVSRE